MQIKRKQILGFNRKTTGLSSVVYMGSKSCLQSFFLFNLNFL